MVLEYVCDADKDPAFINAGPKGPGARIHLLAESQSRGNGRRTLLCSLDMGHAANRQLC